MKRDQKIVMAVGVAALAWLLWPRNAAASTLDPYGKVTYLPPRDEWWPATPDFEWQGYDIMSIPEPDYLRAFLTMIKRAEHTASTIANGLEYQTFYGGSLFANLSDHPAITGEKTGVRLSDAMCRAAGFNPGCVSTAAGAYQIIKPTWERVRQAKWWGPYLPDFSPASQDEAARRLLIERGALSHVHAGEFDTALVLAAPEWASLPGSTAKQGPKSYATVYGYYSQALG